MAREAPRLSPSAYNTWKLCPRKWAYDKIFGLRPPAKTNLRVGVAVHDQIELFLQEGEWQPRVGNFDGKTIDITQIAQAGEEHLLPLRDGVLNRGGRVEVGYSLPPGQLGPLAVMCYVDYIEDWHVTDHKTTSDLFGPWHKTAKQLAKDPQMLWYAYLGLRDQEGDVRQFEMQHIYYQTPLKGKPPKSRALRVPAQWDDALRNRDNFVDVAGEMLRAVHEVERPEDIEGNPDACTAFGGCPFAMRCPAKKHVTRGKTVTFRERMKAKKEAAAAAKATTTAGAAEGQMNPPDTTGTDTVTMAMLEEIGEIVMAHHDYEHPGDDTVATWLRGPGSTDLVRIGFGLRHVDRIVDFIADSVLVDEGDEKPAAEKPAAEKPAAEKPAAEKPAAEKPAAVEGVQSRIIAAILEFLQVNHAEGSPASKKEIKGVLREVLSRKQISDKLWAKLMLGTNGAFSAGSETGVWDYDVNDKGVVWLSEEYLGDEGVSTVADKPRSQPQATPAAPPLPSDWGSLVICIDCMPGGSAPLVRIDEVLSPYYDEVARGGDVRGNPVAAFDLVPFNRGPASVAAKVCADVREGRMKPLSGFMYVRNDHPMASRVERMWPGAMVMRATR